MFRAPLPIPATQRLILVFLLTTAYLLLATRAMAGINFKDTPEFFKEHLQKKSYDIDTAASAIVLFESVVYSIDKDIKGDSYTTSRIRKIIKVLRKQGSEAADVTVTVESSEYSFGAITRVSGSAYNLRNGEMTKTEMPATSIKIEKGSENHIIGKFSIPDVSEGSVIDYSFETKERFSLVIGSWEIQEKHPKLVSEVTVIYPDYTSLAVLTQNVAEFKEFDDTKDESAIPEEYCSPTYPLGGAFSKRWVRRNILASVKEPFIYNVQNYSERIVFKIASLKRTSNYGRTVVGFKSGTMNWPYLNQKVLVNRQVFGQLKEGSGAAARQFIKSLGKVEEKEEYARKIFCFIRDSFLLKNEGVYGTKREIDWVLKNRTGNHFDFHLALISSLRAAGMDANPVFLSTRDQVKLMDDYPNAEEINYVITRLKIGDHVYYLDPTKRFHPFGFLSYMCYNGFAWVVNDTGFGIQLDPDNLKERMLVQVKTVANDASNYQLNFKKTYGKQQAVGKREAWNMDTLKIKGEIIEEVKLLGIDGKLVGYQVENLENPDMNLVVDYTIKADFSPEKIFFSPSFINYFAEVPFKTDRRYNPVELPYPVDINYSLQLSFPTGYIVEEVPASNVLNYDEQSFYKYLISYDKEAKSLMLNTRLNFNRAYFDRKEYKDLKAYLENIIATQQKNLVIKKG